MEFEDILPHLASTWRRGLLVPFIGSGMSAPSCTGWLDMLVGLAREGSVELPGNVKQYVEGKSPREPETPELYRLADKAMMGLASFDADQRAQAFRKALNAKGAPAGTCAIPPQTEALARCYWPLVLTTNYDDLYIVSRMRQSSAAARVGTPRRGTGERTEKRDETDVPEVLGRGVEDCHKVLRSLDAPTRPILWALQGFLGGQAELPEKLDEELIIDEPRRRLLAAEVVAGHQQYQRAINAHPHFRRAFAEVFSRRSLLFLGSGLVEDYLVNLFGEIAHHYGPGPHPHFALFARESYEKSGRELPDARFLQTRLGITPVFYEKYSELPGLLSRLADAVWGRPHALPASTRPVAWLPDELGFRLVDGLDKPSIDTPNTPSPEHAYPPAGEPRRFRLRYAPLPVPDPARGECVIVSAGRNADNTPDLGRQGKNLLKGAELAKRIPSADPSQWTASEPEHALAYRFGDSAIFALAARLPQTAPLPTPTHPSDPKDSRDLGVIVDAVVRALELANDARFHHVHLGPVASGQYRLWSPLHPFVQTLTGIRQYFAKHPGSGIQLLELHVFSPAVWFPVAAGQVPVAEILASKVMKTWVDIRGTDGSTSEILAVTECAPTKVEDLKKLCGLAPDRWTTEILPWSSKDDRPVNDDRLVTPSSIVVFSPRK